MINSVSILLVLVALIVLPEIDYPYPVLFLIISGVGNLFNR